MAQCVPHDAEYPLGLIIDRQFRLDAYLGHGSMARVYRAQQLGVGREVAIKVLRSELMQQAEVVARFREEASLVARLTHPHVVVVHGVGHMPPGPASEVGAPYVVLELLEGRPLSTALDEAGGTLPLPRALHVILALADAVGEAHARGIVHRDIKPDNVMLVERGNDHDFVKLLDFGLARVLREDRDIRTRAGAILGTPGYVSPEGAQGLTITAAADCYALATLLYRCLAGRLPFDAPSAVTVLAQKASQAAPELLSLPRAATTPPGVAAVVMQNLSRRPELRAPDARAFGRSLVDAAREAGLEARDFGLSQTLVGARALSGLSSNPSLVSPAARAQRGPEPPPAHPGTAPHPGTTPQPSTTSDLDTFRNSAATDGASTRRPSAQPAQRSNPPAKMRMVGIVLGCFLIGALAAAAWGAWMTHVEPGAGTQEQTR